MSSRPRRFALPFAWLSFGIAACGGGGGGGSASFPGGPDLAKAEIGWCDMLAKTKFVEASAIASCKDTLPTASAAFLRGMTKCFAQRVDSYGDNVPDKGIIVAECKEEAQFNLPADDATGAEVVGARCDRMLKCEQVPVAECKTNVAKLEAAQRVVFTSTYNARALHEVADCLKSKGCSDNEDDAREACYKKSTEKLVWFP